ncbi:MAG: hypothetical protein GXN96_05390 [Aquificae bacterium]|nr:hypothetical protein [Aquificota bacterium]
MYRVYLFLHLFFAMLWIGGMLYTSLFLQPAAREAEEKCRDQILPRSMGKFFLGVWVSILVLFGTGMALWHTFRPDFFKNPLFHIKLLLFAIMVLNFAYIHLYLYRRKVYHSIPTLVGINLVLGILVVMIITYVR